MIITEKIIINNELYIKTYSSNNYQIERDGITYDEAIDAAHFNRIYTETNKKIGEGIL